MNNKLQELTEKIYNEGINKAREESDKMLESAKQEAGEIVARAHRLADEILKDADKKASELKKNTLNEIQLTSHQLISSTKQKIADLLEAKAVDQEVKKALGDIKFIQETILAIINRWDPTDESGADLKVLLPVNQQQDLDQFFREKVKNHLNQGVVVEFSDKIKGGFKIGPKNGGYLISFTDDDFNNFFRSFLRPKLIEMLYNKQD